MTQAQINENYNKIKSINLILGDIIQHQNVKCLTNFFDSKTKQPSMSGIPGVTSNTVLARPATASSKKQAINQMAN